MARAIAEAGWPLTVWARRRRSLEALAGIEHAVSESVEDLGRSCDLVGICVRGDDDVREVLVDQGLLAALAPGSVVANHGTGSPDTARALAEQAKRAGVTVLDAPVSGGGRGARERTLTVMVGGDRQAAERCRPVFESFASTICHLGRSGAGQLAKLLNNTLFAANLHNAAELLALGDELEIRPDALAELLLASSGASFALEALSRPRSEESLGHLQAMVAKDVAHLSEAARRRGVDPSAVERSARRGVEGVVAAGRRLAAART